MLKIILSFRRDFKMIGGKMDKKIIGKMLTIASVALLLSAAIFICLCFVSDENNNTYLGIALGSLILSNLFNIVKRQTIK